MKYWISMKLMHASFFIHEGTRILSFFWWGLLKRVKYRVPHLLVQTMQTLKWMG